MQRKFILLFFSILLLAACSGKATSTPIVEVPTSTIPPTTTLFVTTSPLTILVLPADLPEDQSKQYQTLVYNLAQDHQMRFQVFNQLTPADLSYAGDALKVVIALPPDPGLLALAAAAPNVQFLAVGIPDLQAGANLSTVGAGGVPRDQQAFLAGYIAGLTAPEWKVGVLYQKDTAIGEATRDAFNFGFVFYCGACRNPFFTQPAGIYPIKVGIPLDTPLSAYNGHADLLYRNVVKVAYVAPEVANHDVLGYMAQKGLLLIGESLPGEDVRSNWIASIQPDLISAIQHLYSDLVIGKGGQSYPTPLYITDVNPSLLNEAKLRLVNEVLTGLQNGTIGTGINP